MSHGSNPPSPHLPQRWALALAWLALAGIYNPWTLDWLLGSGSLYDATQKRIALGLGALCLLWGAWTLRSTPTPRLLRIQVLLLVIFAGTPLAAEGLIRLAIQQEVKAAMRPNLYLDGLSDDDYWKLRRTWQRKGPIRTDPTLGWRTPRSEENPLGILREPGYEPQYENTVLCFGDSFTAGNVPMGKKIPDYIDAGLAPGHVAYNYGVGGYGVGQMYLSYLEHQPHFIDPVIVVSIFQMDLDRTILAMRDGPKPTFRVTEGELQLHGTPIPSRSAEWMAEHPPQLKSFFFAWITRSAWLATLKRPSINSGYRRELKMEVNRAILKNLVADARSKQLRLLFVVYPPHNFEQVAGWRKPFLRRVFEDLQVPWVDGELVLRENMDKTGRSSRSYFQKDNHPNPMANRLFAREILRRIEGLWEIPTRLRDRAVAGK